MRNSIVGVVLMAMFAAAGCGPGLHAVSGQFSYGGVPLEKGIIIFLPQNSQQPTMGTIKAGRYSVELKADKYKVHIESSRPSEGLATLVANDGTRTTFHPDEQFLPSRYNSNTALTCEISGPTAAADFKLDWAEGDPKP